MRPKERIDTPMSTGRSKSRHFATYHFMLYTFTQKNL